MRYQLRYIRISPRSSLRHLKDSSRSGGARQNRLRPPGVSPAAAFGRSVSMCIGAPESASIESRSTRAIGAVGSALPSHGRGHQFESGIAHQRKPPVRRGFSVSPLRALRASSDRRETTAPRESGCGGLEHVLPDIELLALGRESVPAQRSVVVLDVDPLSGWATRRGPAGRRSGECGRSRRCAESCGQDTADGDHRRSCGGRGRRAQRPTGGREPLG